MRIPLTPLDRKLSDTFLATPRAEKGTRLSPRSPPLSSFPFFLSFFFLTPLFQDKLLHTSDLREEMIYGGEDFQTC